MKVNKRAKIARVRLALCGTFGGAIAAVAAGAVVACGAAAKAGEQPVVLSEAEKELRAFIAKYPNTIDRFNDRATVRKDAFSSLVELPAGFVLPQLVAAIDARAFAGVKLPVGFAIPLGAATIDPTAFADSVIDEENYWNGTGPAPGARIVPLTDNAEYIAFNAKWPGKLMGKGIVANAFDRSRNGGQVLTDLVLPSFLKRIGENGFWGANLPSGFKVPDSVETIGAYAFASTVLPVGFTLPDRNVVLGNEAFGVAVFPKGFTLPAGWTRVGFPVNRNDPPEEPFNRTTFGEGFTIPNTVQEISQRAFWQANVPLGFAIPATTRVYSYDYSTGTWVTTPSTELILLKLPSGTKWGGAGRGSAGSTVIEDPAAKAQAELAAFITSYPNTVDQPTGKVVVRAGAFAGRADLPAGFTLPSLVTDISANAFMGARLPRGFTIPTGATTIDATAFSATTLDDDDLWDKGRPEAGAKVDQVENNLEYKAFVTAYPGSLTKKAVSDRAFYLRRDLPADFALPSFVTRIGTEAFYGGAVPDGFRLPDGVTSIGSNAFNRVVLPLGFGLPVAMESLGVGKGGAEPAETSFGGAILPIGFTIPATVREIYAEAFGGAQVHDGFTVPVGAQIYRRDANGTLTTDPAYALQGVTIPAGSQ